MVRFQIIKSTAVPAALLLGLILLVSALPAEDPGPEFLKHFSWREIGPANPGGRITDIEAVESDPRIIYVGAATGGVWKTVNAGDPVDQWGPKAGIYITKDGGSTWTKAVKGLPKVEVGRIGIDASRSQPGTVYAIVSTEKTKGNE
ncbi:MAG: hypothetical protein KJ874_13420, partial [Acidobacteria bacterium]|nr:hypothetical protein [Acidobacteriota bacterium]